MKSNLIIHSHILNDFVEKYFVNVDLTEIESITDDNVKNILSQVEKTLVELRNSNYSNEDASLWYNRELCLRALVVITQLAYFEKKLREMGFLNRGLILLSRVTDEFNRKIMEDPEIVKAIQEDRLEDELKKHFTPEVLKKDAGKSIKSSFLTLTKDEGKLNAIPEYFEPIPEEF